MKARTLVVGDIHGCLNEFHELLDLVQYDPRYDRLILLGDLVDRGPHGAAVVRLARERNIETVLGNHEEKLARYYSHAQKCKRDSTYTNPMRELTEDRQKQYDAMSAADFEWMGKLPSIIRFTHKGVQWLASHAGIPTDKPITQQSPSKLCRVRRVDAVTGAPSKTSITQGNAPGSVYWAEMWKGPESVIYGHIVHDNFHVRHINQTIGIDTGCCFGGRLTAAIFREDAEAPTFQSVKAFATYVPPIETKDHVED